MSEVQEVMRTSQSVFAHPQGSFQVTQDRDLSKIPLFPGKGLKGVGLRSPRGVLKAGWILSPR